jgi:hypothetical protein
MTEAWAVRGGRGVAVVLEALPDPADPTNTEAQRWAFLAV